MSQNCEIYGKEQCDSMTLTVA